MQTKSGTIKAPPETNLIVEGLSYRAILLPTCHHPLFSDEDCTSVLQSQAYHEALEASPPARMRFWYVRLEQNGKIEGMLSFQVKDFNPGDSLKNQANGTFVKKVRYKLAGLIQLKVLCLGNTLVTGDYGFCFNKNVPNQVRTLLMMETIDWLLKLKEFKKIGLIFIKDFYTDIFEEIPECAFRRKYHPIDTQPNMLLDIPAEWKGLSGYLQSLKSKYRVRANKALQMAGKLERVELNVVEIEQFEDQLHELYLKVVDDVGFNLFVLSKGYFTALKKTLGDSFRLWIYKDKGELISFFTVFEDGDVMDAHFLGYDPEVNHRYRLYLNMLLSLIEMASSRGFRQLQLSRTATEIKSSVGAEGVSMWAYMRFPGKVFNWLLPWIYSFFKPDLTWTPRAPFSVDS